MLCDTIKPELEKLYATSPKLFGKNSSNQVPAWFLKPMQCPIAGRPTANNLGLIVGNYPKPPRSDTSDIGLISMVHKNNGDYYYNSSIDQLKEMFRYTLDQNSVMKINNSDVMLFLEENFVFMDIFPFQLLYEADVEGILNELVSSTRQMILDFHNLVISNLHRNDIHVLCMGSVPYKYVTANMATTNFKCFAYVGRIPHPCSYIDRRHTCGEPRMLEGDEAMGRVLTHLTGTVITCDYGRQFFSNNKDVIEGVLAIRRRTGMEVCHRKSCQR